MEKFAYLRSRVVPLTLRNVDTDMIIPAQFLTSIDRDGYGSALFRRLRDTNPDFVLNQPRFGGAQILAADENFGCGSSREHAVWAVQGAGFRVVIAPSFADIFSSNAAKNGLLLITLPPAIVRTILRDAQSGQFEIDVALPDQTVTLPDGSRHAFDYDPFRKHCLLAGLDDLDYLLSRREKIEAFRARQNVHRFFSTLTGKTAR